MRAANKALGKGLGERVILERTVTEIAQLAAALQHARHFFGAARFALD